jgi:hypothetical protein
MCTLFAKQLLKVGKVLVDRLQYYEVLLTAPNPEKASCSLARLVFTNAALLKCQAVVQDADDEDKAVVLFEDGLAAICCKWINFLHPFFCIQ